MELIVDLIPYFIKFCIISAGVLFYWRGTWVLLDSYLFPNHPHWSAWASLIIGVLGMVIYHGILMLWRSNKQEESNKISAAQEINLDNGTMEAPLEEKEGSVGVYVDKLSWGYVKAFIRNHLSTYYFGFVVVNAWRGLWYCQDLYIVFPDTPMLSPWSSHIVGIFALIGLGYFKSVLAPPFAHFTDEEIKIKRM
mmetsp:Transcript_17120/g.28603  ORF Transcript_17120/g.28603 Transcript_17120/m.28603 type:complete len:194 (+) Transcript_17120:155-736(+)